MGKITITKRIANQGHTLALNITKECRTYGIEHGEIVNVTIESPHIPDVDENHD